jgi:hypothetical protein
MLSKTPKIIQSPCSISKYITSMFHAIHKLFPDVSLTFTDQILKEKGKRERTALTAP